MFRFVRTISLSALLMLSAGRLALGAQESAEVTATEGQVYEAVFDLMQFPKENPHVLIANTTLNSGCGERSGNPVLMNGCGMWGPPSSIQEVGKLLHHSWPQIAQATWHDLVRKSATSARLQDTLKVPWPHKVVDLASKIPPTEEWKFPDGVIFLSRVGLNVKRSEAIVYVLFFSYMEEVSTSGNFFLFRLNQNKHWEPAGRVTYMKKAKNTTDK
jgi:hypothetical protein